MFREPPDLFPPDPNAPPRIPRRGARAERPAPETPARADRTADALQRELAQLHLIGPAAGADLRRIVYGTEPPARHRREAPPVTTTRHGPSVRFGDRRPSAQRQWNRHR